MKSQTNTTVYPARGLSLLMMHERPRYFNKPEDCHQFTNPLNTHPFGLDIPEPRPGLGKVRIDFVGANATDMSVESFLVRIRQYAGYTDGTRISKLRVINVPQAQGANYVFFEFWAIGRVVISGETTDFSGSGNTAREYLEDVFAVLSHTYNVAIERVQLTRGIQIRRLYSEQVD